MGEQGGIKLQNAGFLVECKATNHECILLLCTIHTQFIEVCLVVCSRLVYSNH